ncbi:MAG: hypothetical protein A2Y25_03140 [Candidatus Melainabacteria bacterium GWF2_37_15]|nr:MAG: hypothetical protein A2Y25_03140 [Candidatus Melainabacteria bacterium GWF2_37_15]
MKITHKFSLIGILAVAIIVIIQLISYNSFNNYNKQFDFFTKQVAITKEITDTRLMLEQILMPSNDYLITGNPAERENFNKLVIELENKFETLSKKLDDERLIKLIDQLKQKWSIIKSKAIEILNIKDPVGNAKGAQMMEDMDAITEDAVLIIESLDKIINEDQNSVKKVGQEILFIFIGLSIATIIGIIFAVLIFRDAMKKLNKIITDMSESSNLLTSASNQLSTSSMELAEGSTQQAASIEETSATLEQSESMVKQNTENTKQAAILAKQAKDSANKGNIDMQNMMQSMEELKKSSDQIAKIIKVIDEIAFQTNILALNAAVEAARAGEAGQGFAVVAEEVRNLAQRSAQAAKDTAEIIESNIHLSEQGVSVSKNVNESLTEINNQAQKVSDLLDEISAASQEQAQGIAQINKAISQMEQVVQSNASTAEESASASEELTAQAGTMKEIVNSLIVLVNGAQAIHQHTHLALTTSDKKNIIALPNSGKKLNCWEFKNCGRQPGGAKVSEFGVCPAATDKSCDGTNNGRKAGRVCWSVAGTLCGGKVQGSNIQKVGNCLKCDFYKIVRQEENKNFKNS